jgi:hypothetical protein
MIAAHDALLIDPPKVQRRTAMTAHVEQCGGVTPRIAKQHHGFVADPTGQRLFADFVGPCSDVPGIADEHFSRSPVFGRG